MALENREIMEHLASFLDDQALGSLYDSCQTVRNNIDELKLWKKRGHKLGKIARIFDKVVDEETMNFLLYRVLPYRVPFLRKNVEIMSEPGHFRVLCDVLRNRIKIMTSKIRAKWRSNQLPPLLPEIMDAASLAHHGMLGSVECMWLNFVDLASVPAEHLASLASCVTRNVRLNKVININLVCILDNIKCEKLDIYQFLQLEREETQALVRAMESNVREVNLHSVSLDINTLTQYSGQGACRKVACETASAAWYRDELGLWALRKNWTVEKDSLLQFQIKRKEEQLSLAPSPPPPL